MTDAASALEPCAPAFGRAGAYPPRYGWLVKAHRALRADPFALRRADAPVVLGVGSSMVASMGFWSRAFGLTARDPARGGAPTARGRWLLDDDGADPYLERRESLWLLHWWLLSNRPCLVPTWYYVFGYSRSYRLTRSELRRRLHQAAAHASWRIPADSTLSRDIACLVTMYALTPNIADQPRATFEDTLASPFRELDLINTAAPAADSADRTQELSIRRSAGRSAPNTVLTYACLSWAARANGPAPGTISLSRLASDSGGPGRALLTNAEGLATALRRTAERHGHIAVIDSLGDEVLLAYTAPPARLADQVLASSYQRQDGPDAA